MAHALTLRVGVGAVTVTSAATSTAGGSLSCRGLIAVTMSVAVPTTPAAATGALLRGFHRNGSFSSGRSGRRLRTVSAAAASTAAVLHSGSFLRLSFRRSSGSSSAVPVSMSPTATGATALCCGRRVHQLEHLIESLGSGFRKSLTHCFVLTRSRSHVPHAGMHITSQCRGHLPFRARPAASRSPTAHNNPVHPSIVHLPQHPALNPYSSIRAAHVYPTPPPPAYATMRCTHRHTASPRKKNVPHSRATPPTLTFLSRAARTPLPPRQTRSRAAPPHPRQNARVTNQKSPPGAPKRHSQPQPARRNRDARTRTP